MHLILLRHGQTLFNQLQYTQGYFDSPLTALGLKQAENAKILLRGEKIDRAYSSYSERAYDTLEIALDDRPLKIKRDKRLKEFNFGILEGNSDPFYHRLITQLHDLPSMDARVFGGDGPQDVLDRQMNLIEELYERYPNDTIILGGHGCSLKVLYEALAHDSLVEYDPDYNFMSNADAMKIEYRGIAKSKVIQIYRNEVKV